MNESKGLFDVVEIIKDVSGSQEGLLESVLKKIDLEREEKVDNVFGTGWKPSATEFEVVAVSKPTEQQSSQQLRGTGDTYDKALAVATQDGKVQYEGDVRVQIKQTFRIPYELQELRARGRDNKSFLEAMAAEEARLRERYGARMGKEPQDVSYTVTHYSGSWTLKGKSAKRPRGKVLSSSTSNKLYEAEKSAQAELTKKKESKGVLYEGTHTFKVVGIEVKVAEAPKTREVATTAGGRGMAYTPASATVTSLY